MRLLFLMLLFFYCEFEVWMLNLTSNIQYFAKLQFHNICLVKCGGLIIK